VAMGQAAADATRCSIERTLAIVGEKWSLLVLREVFYGAERFDDIQRALGCSRDILSRRLSTLVEAGILTRTNYRMPGERTRPAYGLTERGKELLPVLLALMQWGDKYVAPPEGPSVLVRAKSDDRPVRVTITAGGSNETVSADEVTYAPGPGHADRLSTPSSN
jgi:DNA-binding HxlR family transcriptional regulator